MTMRHFAITQQGASHIARGTNCQDFSATRSVTLEKASHSAVLCGISDGVGSCAFSELGSRIAVTTVLDLLEKELNELEELNETNVLPLLKKAFQAAVEAIQTYADAEQLPFLEFDATLTVALFLEDGRVFFGHAGDDGIVALHTDSTYEMITRRHKGEESNSVFPLLALTTWEFGAAREVASIAMMTDGVLDKTVGMEQIGNLVYLPMIKSALTHPMEDDEQARLLEEHWSNYLASADFRAAATDDLTLVVAQRPAAIPPAETVIFDQAAWDASVERERQRVDKILSKDRDEWAKKQQDAVVEPKPAEAAEEPDPTPFASTDEEEEFEFHLVTAPPQPEEPAEPTTLVVSEPAPEEPVPQEPATEDPTPAEPIPAEPIPAEPQPADPLPEPQPAVPKPSASQSATSPSAPGSEQQPSTTPPSPPAPTPPAQTKAAPPVQKPADGSKLFGQFTKAIGDAAKVIARTVTDASKRVSDKINSDQQQRKDSMPVFFGSNGQPYVVAEPDKPLLTTPTGCLYAARSNDQTMLLRMDDRFLTSSAHTRARIENCVTNLLQSKFDRTVDGIVAFAWPTDILRNDNKEFIGYALPALPGMTSLDALWQDLSTPNPFAQYTLKQRCGIAYNLALRADTAHKYGLFIYDFTPRHLAILPKGSIAFVRPDTFCRPAAPGQYAAPLTAPLRYMPPELLTAQSKHAPLVCSVKTDDFSLALIIHMILSKGQHPFDRGNSSDIVQNIMAGYSCRPQQPFPQEVDKLFQAAFGYNQTSACLQTTIDRRPSAADWMRVLLETFNSLPT